MKYITIFVFILSQIGCQSSISHNEADKLRQDNEELRNRITDLEGKVNFVESKSPVSVEESASLAVENQSNDFVINKEEEDEIILRETFSNQTVLRIEKTFRTVIFWRCKADCETSHYDGDAGEYDFPATDQPNYSHIVGRTTLQIQNVEYLLISISSNPQEIDAGRFSCGVLGVLIFQKSGEKYKFLDKRIDLDYTGGFATATSLPDVTAKKLLSNYLKTKIIKI